MLPHENDRLGPHAVSVRGVGVILDRNQIIAGIDLDVATGEWLTIIGPNGAGKSTLLRTLGGLLPFAGDIELFGTPLGRMRRRDRARLVASVAQDPVVPPGMAVVDYVLLGRTPYIPVLAGESAVDRDAVAEVLVRLDLERFAGRRLESLSGGERQRVFLARALAQGANLLLLDEPTSALDIGHQQDVLELVDKLRRDGGLTVIATMHDLSIAGEYAQRMVLMAGGRVVAAGRPRDVLTQDMLALHYQARVRVIDGEQGPLVVPVRAGD
ncbi:MAG TPA: ABC transporter ATP-binding protein [Micromonosporaceae bacterium]|nr:ABC transporter ATP-binding protein [Micromonosporaceae bacterium]